MKATAERKIKFNPVTVTVTLETQAEVNALYALSNFNVVISESLEHKGCSSGECKSLPITKVLSPFYDVLATYVKAE